MQFSELLSAQAGSKLVAISLAVEGLQNLSSMPFAHTYIAAVLQSLPGITAVLTFHWSK